MEDPPKLCEFLAYSTHVSRSSFVRSADAIADKIWINNFIVQNLVASPIICIHIEGNERLTHVQVVIWCAEMTIRIFRQEQTEKNLKNVCQKFAVEDTFKILIFTIS